MWPMPRRDFLKMNLLAAAGLPAATALLSGKELPKASANERLGLGFIGIGGMGSGTMQAMMSQPDVEVRAVCDVYRPHAERARERTKGKAEIETDFRKLLERKDIDAVVISTPDHWHGLCAIEACKAGKHVYCEKPLTHNVAEGQALVQAARKHERITQMGIQIHAGENYHRVVDVVRSGILGTIHKVHVWVSRPPLGIGHPANAPVPEGLDWDFFVGPAPKQPFNPNRFLFHWRWFWDFGGGLLGDMGCHVLDLVHWAMNVEAPMSVAAAGGKVHADDNTETPTTMEVLYEYPGFVMTWSHTMLSPQGREGRGLGVQFHGTHGTLLADYGSMKLVDHQGKAMTPKIEDPIPRSPGHHREWLDGIKNNKPCSASFDYGHRLTTVCHLGNIALAMGRKLYWNGHAEQFMNDEAANQKLRRRYRQPWGL